MAGKTKTVQKFALTEYEDEEEFQAREEGLGKKKFKKKKGSAPRMAVQTVPTQGSPIQQYSPGNFPKGYITRTDL